MVLVHFLTNCEAQQSTHVEDVKRYSKNLSKDLFGENETFLSEDALLVFWFVNWFGSGTG